MGKRKAAAPQRADDAKRQQLTWNMKDLRPQTVDICADSDSVKQQESSEQTHLLADYQGASGDTEKVDSGYGSTESTSLDPSSELQALIDDSDFYISIFDRPRLKEGVWSCMLGTFSIILREIPAVVPREQEFWLYCNFDNNHLLYYELSVDPDKSGPSSPKPEVVFHKAECSLLYSCLSSLQMKCFKLVSNGYNPDSGMLDVSIYGLLTMLTTLRFPSEGFRPRKLDKALSPLMADFYGISAADLSHMPYSKKHDIAGLYAQLKLRHAADDCRSSVRLNVQHAGLKPRLRQYQREAVRWMLTKERVTIQDVTTGRWSDDRGSGAGQQELHCLYQAIDTKDGQMLYYNKYGGYIVKEKPLRTISPGGGILADEMGLGKTVEVLACILLHPREGLPVLDALPIIEDDPMSNIDLEVEPHDVKLEDLSGTEQPGTVDTDSQSVIEPTDKPTDISSMEQPGTVDADGHNAIGQTDKPTDISLMEQPGTVNTDGHSVIHVGQTEKPTDHSMTEQPDTVDTEGQSVIEPTDKPTDISMTEQPSTVDTEGQSVIEPTDKPTDHSMTEQSGTVDTECQSVIEPTDKPTDISMTEQQGTVDAECQSVTGRMDELTDQGVEVANPLSHQSPNTTDVRMVHVNGLDFGFCFRAPPFSDGLPQTQDCPDCVTYPSPDQPNQETQSIPSGGNDQGHREGKCVRMCTMPFCNIHYYDHTYSARPCCSDGGTSTTETVHPKFLVCDNEGEFTREKVCAIESTCSDITDASVETIGLLAEAEPGNSSCSKKDKVKRKKKANKLHKSTSQSSTSCTDQPVADVNKDVTKKRSRKHAKVTDTSCAEQNRVTAERADSKPAAFECICGKTSADVHNGLRVDCCVCGLSQHADCMNYDTKDPYRGMYKCPHCHTESTAIPSGATLIVSPYSISHQWVDEINKHIREQSLRVLVYTGVHKQGYIQPNTLAQKDIVITSYETLRKEIDYVDLPHSNSDTGRRFRKPKRFMAIPSPLVAVEWWRICLDEAQMVETTSTKTAEMALRLNAVNRWCVTGTPIQRGIEDLYGLFLFLGVDPYWVSIWWQRILYDPFCYGQQEALLSTLHQTLWRTAKKDVIDQICLPPQTEEVHWLNFSPVEEHFYRRQYQECARDAMQRLRKWKDSDAKLNSLDRYSLHQLLHPLVRLRQACCHPQAVRGEFLPIHKCTMTMDELLKQLIRKSQLECEDAHRQWVFALNGLAALSIIRSNYADAVNQYRNVLRSIESHKDDLRTDDLQQLHTLYNLHEILLTKPAGVPPTLRDSQLSDQVKEIKTKYIARFEQQIVQAREAWTPVKKTVRDLTQQLKPGRDWWIELLQWVTRINMDQLLVEKVKDDLAGNSRLNTQSIAVRFRDVRGLQYVLGSHLEEVQTIHGKLVTAIGKLTTEPSVDLINQTVYCCLRPADKVLKTCPFCKIDEQFQEYETKLFSIVDKGVTEVTQSSDVEDVSYAVSTRRQGTWADSEAERALKALISFSRTYGGDRDCLASGGVNIKVLEALKKEFKCLRTMWLYLRERVSALDELDMATTRMRLRFPDEIKTDPPLPNILERSELEQHRLKLDTDRIVGKNELKKKLGQLLYLRNLAKAESSLQGGQNPTPCPICQRELGEKWSVLHCGHCYCLECIRIMVERYSSGRHNRIIKCPMCRQRTTQGEISYVSTRASDVSQAGEFRVKGDHSSKVEGIVSCLLKILKEDSEAKALVFSTWTDVLDILGTALEENDINYKTLHGSPKFQKNLDSFKHSAAVPVLLLPVHSGSNGLNIIEATHVLLVEPILNPAQELQAIGRVHRIGQTKPTVVHRFLVRGTIEERMHQLIHNIQLPVNSNNSEETTLTIGEFSSLFSEAQATDEEASEDDVAVMAIGDNSSNPPPSLPDRT